MRFCLFVSTLNGHKWDGFTNCDDNSVDDDEDNGFEIYDGGGDCNDGKNDNRASGNDDRCDRNTRKKCKSSRTCSNIS